MGSYIFVYINDQRYLYKAFHTKISNSIIYCSKKLELTYISMVE